MQQTYLHLHHGLRSVTVFTALLHFSWTQCARRDMLLRRRSRQRERLSASMLSICLFVCLSVLKN